MDNSTHQQILLKIQATEPGTVLFITDFLAEGSDHAIHKSLSRLVQQKMINRLGKGIYLKPKYDAVFGPILPSLESIARQIAANEHVIIRPTGSYALNKLGLSTQVPTKVVFLTNGSRRTIRIGKGTIQFKPTTPKKLAAQNDVVFFAIQALITLGEKGATEKVIQLLTDRLRPIASAVIRSDARHAPRHVYKTLYQIADKLDKND
ncbi:MAG: DUF6088 family protein [Sphingobacteriales bacterium]|jgi:hypothetical protein